jgi:hypothetical protein
VSEWVSMLWTPEVGTAVYNWVSEWVRVMCCDTKGTFSFIFIAHWDIEIQHVSEWVSEGVTLVNKCRLKWVREWKSEGVEEWVQDNTATRACALVWLSGLAARGHRAVDGWAKSCGRGRYIPVSYTLYITCTVSEWVSRLLGLIFTLTNE